MKDLKAKDVMNREVITVRDDITIQELAAFLTEKEISGAPVVDAEGQMVGVVSLTDIAQNTTQDSPTNSGRSNPDFYVRAWGDELSPTDMQLHIENGELPVREIMTPTVYTVMEDTPVDEIAKTMIAGRIHRLLVAHDNRVIGIITTLDMLKVFLN